MIVAYSDIFSNFYVIPTRGLQRDRLFKLREFTLMGLARFRWMFVAIHQSTSEILDFFARRRGHRLRIRPRCGLPTCGSTIARTTFARILRPSCVYTGRAKPRPLKRFWIMKTPSDVVRQLIRERCLQGITRPELTWERRIYRSDAIAS